MKVLKFSGETEARVYVSLGFPHSQGIAEVCKGHLNSARPTMSTDEPDGMWKGDDLPWPFCSLISIHWAPTGHCLSAVQGAGVCLQGAAPWVKGLWGQGRAMRKKGRVRWG